MIQAAKLIGTGLATTGLIGAGVGIGLVFASLLTSFSNNPRLKTQLFGYALLGFALSEAIGLLALMIPGLGHSSNGATRWIAVGPISVMPL